MVPESRRSSLAGSGQQATEGGIRHEDHVSLVIMPTEPQRLSIVCILVGLSACGAHGRNVFGNPEDDRLISRCTTGSGVTIALYVNTGGGAAVGTSWSVTAERKPELAERQIMYSDYKPALIALKCESHGFVLVTSEGEMIFDDGEIDSLRPVPRDLSEPAR
jgi:hypothetical protein